MADSNLIENVRKIVERALAPGEWALFPETVAQSGTVDQETERLLARWEKLLLLNSNPSSFDDHLRNLGLDRRSALAYLAHRTLPADAILPSWAEFLLEVLTVSNFEHPQVTLECLRTYTTEELETLGLDLAHTPSFPEFLHPFISTVLRRIADQTPNLGQLITPSALEQVARYLLFRLSGVAARTVAYEMKIWSAQWKLKGETPRDRYFYFVQEVLGSPEGQTALFLKYPVLARLLATCSEQVMAATIELLKRLSRDLGELRRYFSSGVSLGPLVSLLMGWSDPHQGGRTVCVLQFASGLKLVYKPRSLGMDMAFNQLLGWLNRIGEVPELRSTRILKRQGYGWSEFIPSRDCASEDELARFYQRQGVLLALFYFLCGRDFHHENIIPHGEWSIPVDLEGILSPGLHVMPKDSAKVPPCYQPPAFSVLATGLLPYWTAGDGDRVLHVASGINGYGDREIPVQRPIWKCLETDTLRLVQEYRSSPFDDNLPRLRGKKIPVNAYLNQVHHGFTMAYRTFLRHRSVLLSPHGPLRAFRTAVSRCLIRNTREYQDLLFWSSAPDQLTSGAAYEVALEMLWRYAPKIVKTVGSGQWAVGSGQVSLSPRPRVPAVRGLGLVDDEKRCLWQGDIPVYSGCPTSRWLRSSAGKVYGPAFERTSYAQMRQRLREASEEDLHWQLELFHASFQMFFQPRGGLPQTDQAAINTQENTKPAGPSRPFEDKSRLLTHAIAIGEALERLALRNKQGITWLTLQRAPGGTRTVEYAHVGPWLYTGTAGISVFLANLAAQTGETRYADLARGALQYTESTWQWYNGSMRFQLLTKQDRGGHKIPVSGYNGLGSLIYALVEYGKCLKDDKVIDDALKYALTMTPEQLGQETNPDILGGAAGTLLVLLHLHKLQPDPGLLDRAVRLSEAIVRCQTSEEGPQGWKVPGFKCPLLGMGHGAAGIAYALLRLYEITDQESLRISAESGINFERAHFNRKERDWPNLQNESAEPHFMVGWCAGAAGIGLARLGLLDVLEDPEIQEEIHLALEATLRQIGRGGHHLCCGEAGRIFFLLEVSRCLKRPDLFKAAQRAGFQMIDFYEREGYWKLQGMYERTILPGLMGGVSGIGLTLLELFAPETTSRVLLLD